MDSLSGTHPLAFSAMRSPRPHRRAVLAGLGALAAAQACPAVPAKAASSVYRRAVGDMEVIVVSDGTLNVPRSFALPQTPPAEVDRLLAAHNMPTDALPVPTNVTLVRTGSELVLIDAGSGPNFQPTAGKLSESLEAAGIAADAITKVVFTHGHADHLWGAIDDFGDGERFPNASYVIGAAEWDFWTNPDNPSRVPDWLKGMAIGSARVLAALEKKIERSNDGDVVAPGLIFVATPGHTPGHMSVLVESGRERVLIGGDVFSNNAVSFARPEWQVGSDYDRDMGVATRRRMLDRLTLEKTPLIGFHLSWPGYGMVEQSDGAYRFVPV